MFPGNDLHWRFYYVARQWKSIFTGGPQLPACKNDDFYWPLALAVTKNATINRFTTATVELLCTSVIRASQRWFKVGFIPDDGFLALNNWTELTNGRIINLRREEKSSRRLCCAVVAGYDTIKREPAAPRRSVPCWWGSDDGADAPPRKVHAVKQF
jgi:hypothetical protein